jgi:LuxR family maltose regulon positive regulatory protein
MPHIWMALSSGHFAAAEQHLQALENQLDAEPEHDTPQLRGEIAAARSSMMVLTQDPRAVAQAAQALSYLSQLAPTHSLRRLLQTNLANAYLNVGELDAAADLIQASLSSGGGVVARAGLRHMLGQIRFVQGKLDEAQRLCEIIFEDAGKAQQDSSVGYAMTHSLLGAIAYDRNQLTEAEAHWQAGLKLATMWHVGIVEITCLFNLARLALGKPGKEAVAAAADYLAQIDERLQGHSWIVELARHWITELRVRLWLKPGDLAAATQWAAQQDIQEVQAGWRVRDYRMLALARVYLAQGKWAAAQTLLEGQLQHPTAARFPMVMLWVRLLLALAYHQQGDAPNAFASLERALMQAAQEGRLRTFLDEGEPMHALLREWRLHAVPSMHSTYRDFADTLLALFGDSSSQQFNVAAQSPIPNPQSLPERLSAREVEVLHLVADGLKNQEIGDKLYITRGTVRIHLNTIYGKLGVQNRVQAISRGREVGVLN